MAAASYRGDYLQAQGQQKMLAEVARQKNCAADNPLQDQFQPAVRLNQAQFLMVS